MLDDLAGVASVRLDAQAATSIEKTASRLARQYASAADLEFLWRGAEHVDAVAQSVQHAVARLRCGEGEPAVVISGLAVDGDRIGPTPQHWRAIPAAPERTPTQLEEFMLALVARRAGEPFGFASLQNGRLFHHLLPIAGHEDEQNGHSSRTELVWHTEDAFTPVRCDFLALLCLRNPSAAGTLFATRDALDALPERELKILEQPRFVIEADDEHLRNRDRRTPANVISIHDRSRRQARVPVLWGGRGRPYMSIDKAFMAAVPGDLDAARALAAAFECLDAAIRPLPLRPGDLLLLDNHRCVHGRAPFEARYDGGDRWMMKLSLTRDLSKSRASRTSAISRIVW
jgi:L-asparagine oxygenase